MIGLEAMNQIKNKADFLWKQRCNEEKNSKMGAHEEVLFLNLGQEWEFLKLCEHG